MRRVLNYLFVCLALCSATSGLRAEEPVLSIWTCEFNENMTPQDAQMANRNWVAYVNEQIPGGGITSVVATPIIGDATKFKYIDSFPSLEAWAAKEEVIQTTDGQMLMEALSKVATCITSTLHYAIETK